MTDILRDLIERVRDLKETVAHSMPAFRWGVVTSVSPLAVQLDADTQPLAGSPTTLTTGLQAGDRVLCLQVYRKVTILGVLKGGGPGHPYAMAAGTISVPFPTANVTNSVTVTFPVGRFSQAPNVTASVHSSVPENLSPVGFANWTTTSATLYLHRSTTTTTGVSWQAIQMTSSSANG